MSEIRAAGDLHVGDVILMRGVRVQILGERRPSEDFFGRPDFFKYWARREDTGVEGWIDFGPTGRVELLEAS